ncbi:MAG TPA: hypothetical protein VJZ27_18155 [Aggregatilineales bacterium]|nr:hypothetical protein [Aggregatilineales bacterium]
MKKHLWITLVLAMIMVLTLAACNRDSDDGDSQTTDTQQLGPLDWDHSGDNIILRVDERFNEGPPDQLANEIPPCTIRGDGHIIWVNELEDGIQILESRLSDETIRNLIELVIFSGFYDWESNFAIPDLNNPQIRSITLNLFSEERTVSRYADWPANGYQRILDACRQASDTPVLFQPDGAWISAYEVPIEDGIGHWRWTPQAAGFALSDIAGDNPPRWITGDLVKLIWENTILPSTRSHVLDGNLAYTIALQVPGIMRDAPPAPSE